MIKIIEIFFRYVYFISMEYCQVDKIKKYCDLLAIKIINVVFFMISINDKCTVSCKDNVIKILIYFFIFSFISL